MRWRNRGWPERTPQPKAAKLPREALQRLHARAAKSVEESLILCELLDDVQFVRMVISILSSKFCKIRLHCKRNVKQYSVVTQRPLYGGFVAMSMTRKVTTIQDLYHSATTCRFHG